MKFIIYRYFKTKLCFLLNEAVALTVCFVRLLQAWKPTGITKKDSDQTLKSLQTHELFQFADELARKRVLNVKKKVIFVLLPILGLFLT